MHGNHAGHDMAGPANDDMHAMHGEHAMHKMAQPEKEDMHAMHGEHTPAGGHEHADHTGHERIFRQRFWGSLLLSLPPGGGIFQADPITSVAGEAVILTE